MSCCEDCARTGGNCAETRTRVGGWHARRRARRHLSVQIDSHAPRFGGAAARHSVPVSEGGTYHAPRLSHSGRSYLERRRSRVGQFTQSDAQQQQAIDSLDRDWNALAVSVCGTARGLGCDTATARTLGAGWVQEFRSSLGDFRAWRDDSRASLIVWGSQFADEVHGWRAELERYSGDVERVSGTRPIATAPVEPTPIADALARAGAATSERVLRPVGIFAGLALALVILSQFMRRG